MTSRGSSGLRHRHGSASFQAVNTFCSSILPTPPSQIHPSQWHWKLRHVTQNNFEDTTLHANIHCHQSLVWLQASVLRSNINVRLSPRPLQDEVLIFTDSGILPDLVLQHRLLLLVVQQLIDGVGVGFDDSTVLVWFEQWAFLDNQNIIQEYCTRNRREGKHKYLLNLQIRTHIYTHTHLTK